MTIFDTFFVQLIIILLLFFICFQYKKYLKKKKKKNVLETLFFRNILGFYLILFVYILNSGFSYLNRLEIVSFTKEFNFILELSYFLIILYFGRKIIYSPLWFDLWNNKLGMKGDKNFMTLYKGITSFVSIVFHIFLFLTILQKAGFDISSLIALGGVGGVVIGFAAKDMFSNFFAGVILYFSRQFLIGDWIRSSDSSFEGVVSKIGWRETQIISFDKLPIFIPNSIFTNTIIVNHSRMTYRRVWEKIGIRYDDFSKLKLITKQVKDYLKKSKNVTQDETLFVHFCEYGASSINFEVYFFIDTVDWLPYLEAKEKIMLKIGEIIEKNNAEIAYPTRRLLYDNPQEPNPTVI